MFSGSHDQSKERQSQVVVLVPPREFESADSSSYIEGSQAGRAAMKAHPTHEDLEVPRVVVVSRAVGTCSDKKSSINDTATA